ncbi:MAG: hypothetical protein ACKV2U_05070 [Bryobacteraceae bacterium]
MKIILLSAAVAASLSAQTKMLVENYVLYDRSHLAITIELKPDPPMAKMLKGSISVSCMDGPHGTVEFLQTPDQLWFEIRNLSPPLPKDSDCQATVNTEPWADGITASQQTGTLKFTTKPQLEIEKETVKGRFGLRMKLKGNYPIDMRKSADYEVYEATLKRDETAKACTDPLFTCTRVPDTRLFDLQGKETPLPPDRVGRVAVYFVGDRLTRSNPVLFVQNIVSTLDEELILKEPKTYEFPSAPKGKEQAYAFISVTHQAGPRAKPGTALDAKFNPLLFRAKRFVHGPDVKADLIWNTVPNIKSNDLITAGWRAERFVRFLPNKTEGTDEPLLPGLRLVPALYFETNRLRTQQNFVAAANATLYFRGMYNPQAIRTRRAYLAAVQAAGNRPIPPEAVPISTWGWSWSFEPGFESGRALKDIVAKASDRSGSITVPSYGIFRTKMRTNLSLEYRRIALESSAEFRYLAMDENVFRETSISVVGADGRPARRTVLSVERMNGVKPAFDIKLRFRIDPLGHYTIETGFKNGALPPGFIYANFYRTGLVVQY